MKMINPASAPVLARAIGMDNVRHTLYVIVESSWLSKEFSSVDFIEGSVHLVQCPANWKEPMVTDDIRVQGAMREQMALAGTSRVTAPSVLSNIMINEVITCHPCG